LVALGYAPTSASPSPPPRPHFSKPNRGLSKTEFLVRATVSRSGEHLVFPAIERAPWSVLCLACLDVAPSEAADTEHGVKQRLHSLQYRSA
jgi:hypothetical protein